MAASLPFAEVSLRFEDIPGAIFVHSDIEDHTVVQLKRWLQCRGLNTKGKKNDLIARCKTCIESGIQVNQVNQNIDRGQLLVEKVAEARTNILRHIQEKPPLLPIVGWKKFPSQEIPSTFDYGTIYQHLIQSATVISVDDSPFQADQLNSSLKENRLIDVHTAKPLQKGRIYFKSGNVIDMEDTSSSTHYFLKCTVMASYQEGIKYSVTIMLHKLNAKICDASCECKASSMGRCNHVAALLFALEDYTVTYGFKPPACTSIICEWNRGRKAKHPNTISAKIDCYISKRVHSERCKFDPRSGSAKVSSSYQLSERRNSFQQNLQLLSAKRSLPACMWEQILQIDYQTYDLSESRREELISITDKFINYLIENVESPMCIPGTEDQGGSDLWKGLRWSLITASVCKEFSVVNKTNLSLYNLLKRQLWQTVCLDHLPDISYGRKNEPVALEQYSSTFNVIVQATGLWINPEKPGLGASPDGLVLDPTLSDPGLVEIKCPAILKNFHPSQLEKLTPNQRETFCCRFENNELKLKNTHKYYYQVQMQMAVTGRKWCDFVVWSPIGLVRDRIKFSDIFWNSIEDRLANLYRGIMIPEFFEQRIPRKLIPFDLR